MTSDYFAASFTLTYYYISYNLGWRIKNDTLLTFSISTLLIFFPIMVSNYISKFLMMINQDESDVVFSL